MKPIIKVEDLSKRYRLGGRRAIYGTLRESLVGAMRAPGKLFARRNGSDGRDDATTLWALRDVTFDIRPGEAVGIIGRNGAGKSTLLKVLSRITEPTHGRVELYGRVGSLLEVGTGFHPELTGRENIFLNGAILGMNRAEIERQFDRIVEFSEIEKFLETPVKHYSSGMYTRLAFAVAAHLEPEILIVDEVLAVGDASFQKKCLGKMEDVAHEGRTVIFVSHNMSAVQSLCSRAIWLHEGRVVEDGAPKRVVSDYLKTSFSTLNERTWEVMEEAPGNDKVRLRRVSVRPVSGTPADPLTIRTPLLLEFDYWNLESDTVLNVSFVLYNEEGLPVFTSGSIHDPDWGNRPFPKGVYRTVCHVPGDLLNDGAHRLDLFLVKDQTVILHQQEAALFFDVQDDIERRGAWHGKLLGAVRPDLKWGTEPLGADFKPLAGETIIR